mmetsp:Transcript_8873/g.39275  ORF Transcript_8873/g.39275 Transcript_8873/m.39275 type:complete len:99 (+) Transcript_8873:126-422(+)|eukprot:CAMPEP_0113962954 /NCGR_PEP_ID=MMETSP0011_2-20120614/6229_1 /TAXON_ID=101924 /ORGANISM="Rhodosorus marinus" /LENGTH=98 /DNA_ID=CAMNT_0000974919 /DNA_START=66 /DNA_END=362 /DNA_ORIENTATION=+ /assembly_acc=CAM_ASM_000156
MSSTKDELGENVRSTARKLVVGVSSFVEQSYDVPEIRRVSESFSHCENNLTITKAELDRTQTAAQDLSKVTNAWHDSLKDLPEVKKALGELLELIKKL